MDNRKKAIVLRVGGLGDCLILTPVAKALHAKGYDVDVFIGSPTGDVHELFYGIPYINEVKKIVRVNGIDCFEVNADTFVSVECIKPKYDLVVDLKFSVENNHVPYHSSEGWRDSINSNYQNWVDLSLGWANVDPMKIADEDKVPEIIVPQKYTEWMNTSTLGGKGIRDFRVIGIQLQASSLIRTWYKMSELPEQISREYPNDVVVIFADGSWWVVNKNGKQRLDFPEGNPLFWSAALIGQMDVFIAADSGMSHIAEAMKTNTIGIYTTVPAWTRTKYYKYAHPIEADVACYPCFTLHVFCPLEVKKAQESISERERQIMNASKAGVPLRDAALRFSTAPKALSDEVAAAAKRIEALSAAEPACVKSVTYEKIFAKLSEFIGKKKPIEINLSENVEVSERVGK